MLAHRVPPWRVRCSWRASRSPSWARRAPLLHSYTEGYGKCAAALEALDRDHDESVLIGEIGVFGFATQHRVIDVGALVSPDVLPLKNQRLSLMSIARETNAAWLVISDIAVERNHYPSVGQVWGSEEELAWFDASDVVAQFRDKRLIRLGERPSTRIGAAAPTGKTAALARR